MSDWLKRIETYLGLERLDPNSSKLHCKWHSHDRVLAATTEQGCASQYSNQLVGQLNNPFNLIRQKSIPEAHFGIKTSALGKTELPIIMDRSLQGFGVGITEPCPVGY